MIAVLSDAPTLTTGFGRTTKRIADALHNAGRAVACFGMKARPDDVREHDDYLVWVAEQGGHWTTQLPGFLAHTNPQALIVNMDAYNAAEVVPAIRNAGYNGRLISYVVFDGLPVGGRYLDVQRACDMVLASSHTAAAYLRSHGIAVAGVAPPGVDMREFRPDPHREGLRGRTGVADAKVIGVFGTNTERKQTARVIAALPAIIRQLAPTPVRLYLHCREVGFWRLGEFARDLGVADHVIFPAFESFEEWRGVPTERADLSETSALAPCRVSLPSDLSYVDRINLCDVVINVPHSGDIEQVILEAQACGVALIHADDEGVMAEAVGAGGLLLPAVDVGVGRCGERIQHVATSDIASATASLLLDDGQRSALQRAGLQNASRYPWKVLETEVCRLVSNVVGSEERT